ncbi:Allophanate hydrolase 2 subunit 1 [Microbacterium esteraromaticum]|uniref:Allophanate hydrolase 2 subunit 1 n=1 Tax=Microbacterium esteraromaticum TaxID=57043 RepID=A0A1R4KLI0_9MICO|nr:urea amidolyase family protein [Microbacterium esteraromaticum]SJN45226.1 Allophanate hydrolase 2 subunit 1 [Microbacterium esteraromaticum]
MRVLTASDRAVLVEAADLDEAMRLNAAWVGLPGVIERVPGARTVLVRFDPSRITPARLVEQLESTVGDASPLAPQPEVDIEVHYAGEDLDEVAALLDVTAEEVVNRHLAARWQVAFTGFAPGFGYIVGDDPLFDVPRRSSPRTRVPAGAVGLAGNYTGIYPRQSPGGWQLIGVTQANLWDIHREPPALLVPGARVRFVRVGADAITGAASGAPDDSDAKRPDGGGHADAVADDLQLPAASDESGSLRNAIEIVQPGLQLLVQDLGRPGFAALGVSASGTVDRTALRDANRAVGNAPEAAALESVGAVSMRFHGDGVAAVTGAVGELTMTDARGEPRPITHGIPFATYDGDELSLRSPLQGLRYLIAVRGGIRVPAELGSMSSDTLGSIGPGPLLPGDVVRVGTDAIDAVDVHPWPRALPASGDLIELSVTLGPRDDWFTPAALRTLTTQEWRVTAQADRVGIRLLGDVPLERAVTRELPSEGAVVGAIQVPADGQPVLFLADHPVTGGYPIIGALTTASLDLAGQLAPGVRVRFRVA